MHIIFCDKNVSNTSFYRSVHGWENVYESYLSQRWSWGRAWQYLSIWSLLHFPSLVILIPRNPVIHCWATAAHCSWPWVLQSCFLWCHNYMSNRGILCYVTSLQRKLGQHGEDEKPAQINLWQAENWYHMGKTIFNFFKLLRSATLDFGQKNLRSCSFGFFG